jgi:dTDP-4-dehydrorhamnose reductase
VSERRLVAVIGAAGQLGRDLCAELGDRAWPLTRADFDLCDAAGLRACLGGRPLGAVVNCAAYNFVDRAEDEPQAAWAVNALGVRNLAEACRDLDLRLLHFSTDYVFGLDAKRRTPYVEGDPPGPLSVYGVSKLAGEYFVRSLCPRHLVIRTCGLYGRHGSGGKGGNFVETMLKLAAQGRSLRVVHDQTLTPTATADVARATVGLLASPAQGVRHVTNTGQCTWFEFASAIFALAGVNPDLEPTTSRAYGSRAARPVYSVLRTSYADVPPLPSWRDALSAYLSHSPRTP